MLAVPLLRSDQIIGALVVRRKEPGEFPEHTVKLLQTFADQSVLAIQNARLFREIEDKSRQLDDASQHKSQFLANMSHELRTPLNAILGYTELMADGAYGEPSEKMLGILKRLEANGKHLLGLINDVLDLSKIEAGQLVLELSDYSVQDIAQTVRSTLEPLAADKKLAFKVEVATELPPGRGDGRRLTQVLINLVGNAIKFTDAGEVAIKAEANNGSFHVSVRDTGPGISAADQAKLFQEFQQADNAITRKKGGTGLGLAISKRIIEMHGGKIWVESQPRPRLDVCLHAPGHRRAAGGGGMSKRILVVEDQEDDRQIIRDMLAGTDYAITEAEDGEEALAAIAKERPDLILMEIQLPSMDGYEAMRRIRTIRRCYRSRSSRSPRLRRVGKNRRHGRRAAQRCPLSGLNQTSLGPRAMSAFDPNVWSGRASQEVFVELVVSGLASMYPASDWSLAPGHHGYQRAGELISGQASTDH